VNPDVNPCPGDPCQKYITGHGVVRSSNLHPIMASASKRKVQVSTTKLGGKKSKSAQPTRLDLLKWLAKHEIPCDEDASKEYMAWLMLSKCWSEAQFLFPSPVTTSCQLEIVDSSLDYVAECDHSDITGSWVNFHDPKNFLEDMSSFICMICQGVFRDACQLDSSCEHMFCYTCMEEWARQKGCLVCPVCRANATTITRVQFINMFVSFFFDFCCC
jgi:hypothetical protein